MKFAHMADCHIGSWRDPKLRELSTTAFVKAVDACIEKTVDFILIAGDLFDSSLPSIDHLKQVVKKLKQLKDKDIPVYIVPGSHDFSPSGKTILDVLEHAGLLINVVRIEEINDKIRLNFTIDKKTGVKITGLLGKKGSLEKTCYQNLIRNDLEKEPGFKIFMFHTALTEFKPAELGRMESFPLSLLPKNFDYYAGGHVHHIFKKNQQDFGLIVFPGPLFPNNFWELEKLNKGGFYIFNNGELEYEPIQVLNVFSIKLDCSNKTPSQVEAELIEGIKNKEFYNTIVTIRLFGYLEGRMSDIDFKAIFSEAYIKSAYFVMKNTSDLTTKDFKEVEVSAGSVEDVEGNLIKEHLGQANIGLNKEQEEQLITELIHSLNLERMEGEKVADFEKRLFRDTDLLFK